MARSISSVARRLLVTRDYHRVFLSNGMVVTLTSFSSTSDFSVHRPCMTTVPFDVVRFTFTLFFIFYFLM
jgi:hypothetical protein